MLVTIAICVLSSALCSGSPNLEITSTERDTNDVGTESTDGLMLSEEELPFNGETYKDISDTDYHDKYPNKRKKRVGSFVAIGALALRALLTGTKPIYSSGSSWYRNYAKPGDYVTAMKDFLSVNPVRIEETTTGAGVKVMKGTAGDRRLVIRSHGITGEPTLEIIDKTGKYLEPDQPYIDRIFYNKLRQ